MAGSIAIPNGKAMVVPLRVNVEQIALEVQFAPGTVRLARLSAKAGDGSINGSGQLALHGYAPDRIDASISLDRWPAISTPQYVAHTSGRVRLAGLVATPAITGNIDVTDATLKPDLSMLDSNRVKPDPTIQVVRLSTNNFVETPADEQVQITKAQPTAIFRDYSADLVITIERNAWIRHTNATVNLDGHLHIQKKLDSSLRISGIIEALHGWVQFQQRRFMVKHGVVSFGGGPEIDPVLDLTAENKIRSYTVAINVNGTAKKPSLVLTSTPELEQADILSLILFGRTTQDLTDRQQAKLGQQAATMAGGFAASQLASSVTNALGLQDVGLDVGQVDAGGDSGIGIGHYFTDDVYVSASHGLAGQGEKLSLDYYLTHDLSISTSATYSKGASGAAPAASNNSGTNSEIGATWQRRY
jgi:translocation and assembly module TamB